MSSEIHDAAYWAQKIYTFKRFEEARDGWFKAAGIPNPFLKKRDPSDLSIGTGDFTQGIPAFWFARAVDPASAERLYTPYRDSAYVRSAIKFVFRPVASVDLVFSKPKQDATLRRYRGHGPSVYTRHGRMVRQPEDEIELPLFRKFLREPMRGLTYEDFVEASIGWYLMQECYWVLGDRVQKPFPEVDQTPYEPILVPRPDQMRAIKDTVNGRTEILAWQYVDNSGKLWTLEPTQVIRLFGWNPYDPHHGLGDYASASIAAESHWMAGKFKRQLTADNDTAPIISAKNGTPTDTQMQQIRMQLAERRMNKMRGISKTLFLPGEIDFTDPQVKAVDASFIAGMLEDRHEIYQAFGVPPSLADVKAAYSIGSASDQFALIFNTCIPVGNKFVAVVEKLIKALTGEDVECGLNWDEHYVMQEVRSERTDQAAKFFEMGMPMSTISEYLRLDLPPFANDDIGYIPINMAPTQSKEEIKAAALTASDFSEGDNNNDSSTEVNADNEDNADVAEDPDVKAMMVALERRTQKPEARSQNEALWNKHMQLRSKTVRQFSSKCSKIFNDYRLIALRRLEALKSKGAPGFVTKGLADVVFNPDTFVSDLIKGLDPVQRAALDSSIKELHDELGTPDDPWTMPPADVRNFITSRDNLLRGVGPTVHNQIKTTLDEGVAKGETMDQLADRIRSVFNRLTKHEAKRIAITETAAAYGYSRNKGMVAAGITHKGWLSNHGPHVRPAHRKAEAQYGTADKAIPIAQPFDVGGEALMYPGDPKGSAGNVINCHCIQLARQVPKTTEANP